MKLRVVGWCNYDEHLPCGDNGWAARNAIIDEIRAKDFDFLGLLHVEASECTPVLNDGYKYCFSQQGWNDLMTEARRFDGETDYANYYIPDEVDELFRQPSGNSRRPQFVYIDKFEPETDLNETIEIAVTQRQFDCAANKNKLRFADFYRAVNEITPSPDEEKLRRVYNGDTLVLLCGDKRASYLVTNIERKHIANSKKYNSLLPVMRCDDRVVANRAKWEYELSTLTLVIELTKTN